MVAASPIPRRTLCLRVRRLTVYASKVLGVWAAVRRKRALEPDIRPSAVDLFAGCGGATAGLKKAGFQVVAAVENDPVAAETFMCNHPDVPLLEDVRRITGPSLLQAAGLGSRRLDLLVGCPPCQGFSSVRRLNGGRRIQDRNNLLIRDFLRLVRSVRPRAVMMENVPWLLRTQHFAAFKAGLRKMGYSVRGGVEDAQYFGVPQRRRRALVIAMTESEPALASRSQTKPVVRDAIGNLPHPRDARDRLHRLPEQRTPEVRALIRSIPKNGGSRSSLPRSRQLDCHKRCNGFKDVYGRMAWNEVAPTITGGCFNPSKGRFLHPSQNRNITLREAALLQGFPARYYFPIDAGKEAIARLIGNALPPEFVRRHAETIREALAATSRSDNGVL